VWNVGHMATFASPIAGVSSYDIIIGNDWPNRDPRSWIFFGRVVALLLDALG
jgi:hypothetical protein